MVLGKGRPASHPRALSILGRGEYHSGNGRNRNLVGGADRNKKEQITSSKMCLADYFEGQCGSMRQSHAGTGPGVLDGGVISLRKGNMPQEMLAVRFPQLQKHISCDVDRKCF